MELKAENIAGHLLRKQSISNFLKTRKIQSEEKQIEILKSYAKTLKSNERIYKICKTICASKITFKIFKKWVDKKVNHIKQNTPNQKHV